jgi:hypothetical protein
MLADIKQDQDKTVLVIQDKNGKGEYILNEGAVLLRNGGPVDSGSLKVGDEVVAEAESGKLSKVEAVGVKAAIDGVIEEIHITREKRSIKFEDDFREYLLDSETIDVYALRVGMRVRLNLDSLTATALAVLDGGESVVSGRILCISDNSLSLEEEGASIVTISIKDSTAFVDGASSKAATRDILSVGMKVNIVLSSDGQPTEIVAVTSA